MPKTPVRETLPGHSTDSSSHADKKFSKKKSHDAPEASKKSSDAPEVTSGTEIVTECVASEVTLSVQCEGQIAGDETNFTETIAEQNTLLEGLTCNSNGISNWLDDRIEKAKTAVSREELEEKVSKLEAKLESQRKRQLALENDLRQIVERQSVQLKELKLGVKVHASQAGSGKWLGRVTQDLGEALTVIEFLNNELEKQKIRQKELLAQKSALNARSIAESQPKPKPKPKPKHETEPEEFVPANIRKERACLRLFQDAIARIMRKESVADSFKMAREEQILRVLKAAAPSFQEAGVVQHPDDMSSVTSQIGQEVDAALFGTSDKTDRKKHQSLQMERGYWKAQRDIWPSLNEALGKTEGAEENLDAEVVKADGSSILSSSRRSRPYSAPASRKQKVLDKPYLS